MGGVYFSMATTASKIHPHDIGLSEPAIRKRRRSRRLSTILLTIAILTAALGWPLYGSTIIAALKIRDQPLAFVFIAYGLLIVSSVTLVLGIWYALLAQVERLARMVDAAELEEAAGETHCPKCHEVAELGDRFCRKCGGPVHEQKH